MAFSLMYARVYVGVEVCNCTIELGQSYNTVIFRHCCSL